MTHTQKRKIHLEGELYEWCIRGNSLYTSDATHITIYKKEGNGAPIYLNPYPWDLEIKPSTIKAAIKFSLANKWNPEKAGTPFKLNYENGAYKVVS